jgi:hypothetical protein
VRWRKAVARVLEVLLPWPRRAERKARLEAARVKAAHAKRKTEEAVRLQRDLEEILERNHFAQTIMEGLMRRGQEEG